MRYDFDLTIPANTTQDNPTVRRVKLTAGTLTRAEVYYHAGPHNAVFVTISSGIFQLVPAQGTQALFGDNMTHDVPLSFPITMENNELTVRGWSPLTRYDHTVTIRFHIDQDAKAIQAQYFDFINSLQGGTP